MCIQHIYTVCPSHDPYSGSRLLDHTVCPISLGLLHLSLYKKENNLAILLIINLRGFLGTVRTGGGWIPSSLRFS